MWRFSEAEVYCVRMKKRITSEVMQFDTRISMRRYFPPRGTPGFARRRVSGNKRLPTPPPKMIATTSFMSIVSFPPKSHSELREKYNGACRLRQSKSGSNGAQRGKFVLRTRRLRPRQLPLSTHDQYAINSC